MLRISRIFIWCALDLKKVGQFDRSKSLFTEKLSLFGVKVEIEFMCKCTCR